MNLQKDHYLVCGSVVAKTQSMKRLFLSKKKSTGWPLQFYDTLCDDATRVLFLSSLAVLVKICAWAGNPLQSSCWAGKVRK